MTGMLIHEHTEGQTSGPDALQGVGQWILSGACENGICFHAKSAQCKEYPVLGQTENPPPGVQACQVGYLPAMAKALPFLPLMCSGQTR